MFCQNCGAQLADNAKFCGSCGTSVNNQPNAEAAPPAAETNTAQSAAAQPAAQGEYTQQSYSAPQNNAQQTYNTQQSYNTQQAYNAQPVSYGATKKRGFGVGSIVVLVGAALMTLGFFLPFYSYGFSLADIVFSFVSFAVVPYAVFLVAGLLGILFGFTNPRGGLLSALLGLGGFVYLFIDAQVSLGTFFSQLFQIAGVGLYLMLGSIVVLLVGGIMGKNR